MGYKAGTLDLDILGISTSAIDSIDKTVKSLNSLSRSVNKVLDTQFVFAGQKIEVFFRKIAESTNAINTKNIENLASTAKSLTAISNISKLEKMNFDVVAQGFSKLNVAIKPFIDQVKEAETSLNALYGIVKKTSNKKFLDFGDTKSKFNIFNISKWGVALHAARRMGNYLGDIVNAGSDYTETLNLWQVAMRNNLDLADEFVKKINTAYGISSKTVMNAQATFKNMIGSLGQIADETAYKLSESLVQMSADFSSLYNVQLESAFTKMQAMLAGQVRPIRSAGLDITETTLYQYYQAIGGTKSMRELNRTEKQLLSILAVYKQMGSAGALGDMTKTLNQFANQSRMMTEYWAELKSWSGLILKDLIDQSGALIYINAALITITEVIKAIAKARGIGEENFIDGLFESAEATNEELDELQGKLLGFDKFRSLSGEETNVLSIDEKLLDALTGYESKITEAQNAAQELADTWLEFWLTDEGTLTQDAQDFLDTIKSLTTAVLILNGIKLGKWIYDVAGKFLLANDAVTLLGDAMAALGISFLITEVQKFIKAWDDMPQLQRWIGIILALAAAVAAVAVSVKVLAMDWAGAIGLGALVAGTTLAITRSIKIPNYEKGASDIDSGTVFRAGEFGKTEAVYTGSNGKTNVANVKQMEQAFYNALVRHSAEGNDPIIVQAYLDGEKVYENTTARAKSRGKVWANV